MTIDFKKMGGLVPAIIQDADTRNVLMLGFMNEEAYQKTLETGKVTFWSRTRKTLWTKGETSGNFLNLVSMDIDCDQDTLLVKVHPIGPTCHKGTDTCWGETNEKPEKRLITKDKKRKANYRYYTDQVWGQAQNYHITLDSSVIGIDKCSEIIIDIINNIS